MEQVASLIISKITRDLFDRIAEYASEEEYEHDDGSITSSTMMLGYLKHGSHKEWIWEEYICKLECAEEYFLGKLHGTCYYWADTQLAKTIEYWNGFKHGKTQIFGDSLVEETYEKGKLVEVKEYDKCGMIEYRRKFPGQSEFTKLFCDGKHSQKIEYKYFDDTDTYYITKYRSNDISRHSTWYLKNGVYHGEYCTYHESGRIESKCKFVEGEKHGLEQTFYIDGSVKFEANYRFGKLHGAYRKFLGSEEVETANYVNDLLHGTYQKIDDTTRIVRQYNMGKLHGLCIVYESDSVVKQFTMKNGVLHGPHMSIECCYTVNDNYANGFLHGETVATRNKIKYVIQFQNGIMHGKCQIYRKNKLIIDAEYNRGIREYIKKIKSRKNIDDDSPYCRNCKFNGDVRFYELIND